jgi:hypothetical protein
LLGGLVVEGPGKLQGLGVTGGSGRVVVIHEVLVALLLSCFGNLQFFLICTCFLKMGSTTDGKKKGREVEKEEGISH